MNTHVLVGSKDNLAELISRADRISRSAAERAERNDHDDAFPSADVEDLRSAGLLMAPLPARWGGLGLGTSAQGAGPLLDVLRSIGRGSLSLGRLYEGHVNAIALISRYGTEQQIADAAADVVAGCLFGVWNTDPKDFLRVEGEADNMRLVGGKTLASGAGFVSRPLVTARLPDGSTLMVVLRLDRGERADTSAWRALGMRASATGSVDLTGIPFVMSDAIGSPGDYSRQPAFSAGAWRFAAVQLGGIEALVAELKRSLVALDRHEDPHQQTRAGKALIAMETAHLWIARAAVLAESIDADPDATVAYVNLARCAVERAGLDVLDRVQRSIGLAAFLRPHPVERIARDLATYLRQPGPDRALTHGASYFFGRAEDTVWP